jgi:ferredoxin-NADP reductase
VFLSQEDYQKSKLMRREEVAEGTMAFHFEKPSGFNFKAGQLPM